MLDFFFFVTLCIRFVYACYGVHVAFHFAVLRLEANTELLAPPFDRVLRKLPPDAEGSGIPRDSRDLMALKL